jgi:hypothetical protein
VLPFLGTKCFGKVFTFNQYLMWQIFVGKSVNIHGEFTNKKYICEYIISPNLELCSDHFSGQLCKPGVFNKDPTVWLDETRPANTCIPLSFLGMHQWCTHPQMLSLNVTSSLVDCVFFGCQIQWK